MSPPLPTDTLEENQEKTVHFRGKKPIKYLFLKSSSCKI